MKEGDGVEWGRGRAHFYRVADSPRGSILYKEETWVKFNKDIIITHESMGGKKMFTNVRYMEDIAER
jgi:hypothetical protein